MSLHDQRIPQKSVRREHPSSIEINPDKTTIATQRKPRIKEFSLASKINSTTASIITTYIQFIIKIKKISN